MDHNSLIDKNTYDVYKHAEDCPLMFICDKNIASSVALLNKKGYKTYASCGGHYKLEFYEYYDCDISNYDEYSSDDRIIIKRVGNGTFDYWEEVDKTHIYILFDKKYSFANLPVSSHIVCAPCPGHFSGILFAEKISVYVSVHPVVAKHPVVLHTVCSTIPDGLTNPAPGKSLLISFITADQI